MDISSISKLQEASLYQNKNSKIFNNENNNASFEALFQSAMSMINETNELSNNAEEEEMRYAMGMADSTHALQAAQQKANISLQYTVAVRNTVLDAYREIMNMQF